MKVNIDVSEYTEADEKKDRAWHEGYRAFVDGVSRMENPYYGWVENGMPLNFSEWAKGWHAAEESLNATKTKEGN